MNACNLTLRLTQDDTEESLVRGSNQRHISIPEITSTLKHGLYPKIRCINLGDINMAKRSKTTRTVKLTPSKKRLSSEDFLKKADKLWREGPPVKYKYPDAWQRALD
jgi:hypothetical protein